MTQSANFCDNCGFANTSTSRFCRSCGTALTPLSSNAVAQGATGLLTGVLNGQYQIIAALGKGGMGAVYKAKELSLDRLVAIKEMSLSSLLDPSDLTEAVQLFRQEARMLAGLQHPRIPRIYAHFEQNGRWYLVMDYIEGETLEDRLGKAPNHRLAVKQSLEYCLELCDALQYLHGKNPPIIFRDLKPANIMCGAQGHISLIDFGIARHFKPGQAKDTTNYGSAGYAPPEQYGRAQTTERSDIYALGAVLHQMLTGSDPADNPFHFAPLTGTTVPELGGHPVLAGLGDLVMSMVNMTPAQRPGNVAQVGQMIRQIVNALAQPRQAAPFPGKAPSGSPAAPLAVPSSQTSYRQITLLYATKDKSLAQELDAQLQAASASVGISLKVRHNDDASAGNVIAQVWADRLRDSDVFVPLVSADLWSAGNVWDYVQEAVQKKQAERIVPVRLRPCLLVQGKMLGLAVIPSKPITSFSGASREDAWLEVVTQILQTLQTVPPTNKPVPASLFSGASSVAVPVAPPAPLIAPAPIPQTPPLVQSPPAFLPPSPQTPPASIVPLSAPPASKEWEITLLFAPEDDNWVAPMTRVFTILQRTTLSSAGIRFKIHRGAEGLPTGSEDELKERIAASRLTLALISPDFLASDWMDRYEQIQQWLESREHGIIPVLLRDCQWQRWEPIPSSGAIKSTGNDAAWANVSKTIKGILRRYYPGDMPAPNPW